MFDEKGNFVVGNYNQQKTMDPDKFLKGSNTKQIEGSLWTNDSGYFSKQELDDHNELMGK